MFVKRKIVRLHVPPEVRSFSPISEVLQFDSLTTGQCGISQQFEKVTFDNPQIRFVRSRFLFKISHIV